MKVLPTKTAAQKVHSLLLEYKTNKDSRVFRREIDQMKVTAEALMIVMEQNFELRNENELVLLAGHLLVTNHLNVQDFWEGAVIPIFEVIDDLILDMPYLINGFVTFFEKLIVKAKVNNFIFLNWVYFITNLLPLRYLLCIIWHLL